MAGVTLTKASYWARFFVRYGSVGIVSIVLVVFLGKTGWTLWKKAHPDPPPPPDMAFGRVPKIQFPEQGDLGHSFVLETPDGDFGDFGDRIKIFFIPRSSSTILALENAKKLAKDFEFAGQPEKINEGTYKFESLLGYELTINALTGRFDIKYPYLNDQTLIRPASLPDEQRVTQEVKAYLNRAGKLSDNIDEGVSKISYYKIMPGELVQAASYSEADLLRVDLFRSRIEDEYRVVTAEANKASISLLVSGSEDEKRKIVEVNYRYVPIDVSKLATYPIKPVDVAWMDLENGDYFAAKDAKTGPIVIRRVELAYFEPLVGTNFFQPVYVFEGDGDFVGYVPALASEWTID